MNILSVGRRLFGFFTVLCLFGGGIGYANTTELHSLFTTVESRGISLTSSPFLPDSAVSVDVTYMGDILGNVSGGRRTGVTYLDNIDVIVEYTPSLENWEGARFSFYLLGNQGGSISSLVGDAQGVSNIEAINSWRLFEGLYFQRVDALNSSLMAGLYDVNAEFDLTYTGSFFLNSSHGIGAGFGQSGITGPSTFPYTGLAFRTRTRIAPGLIFKAATIDGVPAQPDNLKGTSIHLDRSEEALLVGELSFYGSTEGSSVDAVSGSLLNRQIETRAGLKVAVGAWHYTEERKGFRTRIGRIPPGYHEHGIYALANIPLYRNPADNQFVSSFARIGINDGRINRFAYYFGGGVLAGGMIPGRDQDRTGIALATAVNSNAYLNQRSLLRIPSDRTEINIEFSHRFYLTEWLSLQGDIQYIHNPNMITRRSDAIMVGIRTILGLTDMNY